MTTEERINNKMAELGAVRDVIRSVQNMVEWYQTTDENGKIVIEEGYEIQHATYQDIIELLCKKYNI